MNRLTVVLVLLTVMLTLAGTPVWAGSGTEDDPWVVGMSQCNLGEPWRVQMNRDIERAGSEHSNLTVEFKDAQNDSLRQRSHIEEFVAQKVDLILVSPLEAAPLTQPVRQAYQAGIPVIVIDRRVIGEDYTCFIGGDNKAIGRMAGEWIVSQLENGSKLVEIKGLMTSTPGQDRHSGFRQALEGQDLEIVFEADAKWLEPNGRKEMESALARYDDIDLVYAHNDPMAHGAYLAARAAGREDDIKFVGIDALPHEGLMYVKKGVLAATFYYPTCGAEAVDLALQKLGGEDIPKEVTLDTVCITAANVDEWLEKLSQ